jgi:hypothetical protein
MLSAALTIINTLCINQARAQQHGLPPANQINLLALEPQSHNFDIFRLCYVRVLTDLNPKR